MGLLSPFSKEARSGLSLNTPKQKGIHFPFPGILLLFGQPGCPAKTGNAVPAGTSQKPITQRKFSVWDFPAARPSSDGQICLHGSAEDSLPPTSLLLGTRR